MSQSTSWSSDSTSSVASSHARVADSGRLRMSIPNLVHGITAADTSVHGVRRVSLDDRGGGGEASQVRSSEVQSPIEPHYVYDESVDSGSSAHLPKRKGPLPPRLYCTYTHPVSGKQCVSWTQGFSSQSDLSRHYMNIHGQEEIRLIKMGELSFENAQVVTSLDKLRRLDQHFSSTKFCESCGTAFSSGRRDAISRHIRKGVCTKKKERNS